MAQLLCYHLQHRERGRKEERERGREEEREEREGEEREGEGMKVRRRMRG